MLEPSAGTGLLAIHAEFAGGKLVLNEIGDIRDGLLDREAVEVTLAAAGQRAAARVRGNAPASLSEREAEVLCLLARGLTNKQIAAKLVLSPRTVQHHVEHIFDKTGVRTRAAAAVFAMQHDLLARWAV